MSDLLTEPHEPQPREASQAATSIEYLRQASTPNPLITEMLIYLALQIHQQQNADNHLSGIVAALLADPLDSTDFTAPNADQAQAAMTDTEIINPASIHIDTYTLQAFLDPIKQGRFAFINLSWHADGDLLAYIHKEDPNITIWIQGASYQYDQRLCVPLQYFVVYLDRPLMRAFVIRSAGQNHFEVSTITYIPIEPTEDAQNPQNLQAQQTKQSASTDRPQTQTQTQTKIQIQILYASEGQTDQTLATQQHLLKLAEHLSKF